MLACLLDHGVPNYSNTPPLNDFSFHIDALSRITSPSRRSFKESSSHLVKNGAQIKHGRFAHDETTRVAFPETVP